MSDSLNQQTYERMKKDIMTFALKPGEPVSASKVATRYGVSRTPAREALVRLQDEGMVDIFPQSGSVISRINEKRIRQEWFVRVSLEMGMVDEFFRGVGPQHIERMRECVARMAKLGGQPRDHEAAFEYIKCDDDFHRTIYMAAGENLAADIIANTLPNYRRLRLLIDLDNVNKDRTIADHEKLIRFIEEGRVEEYRTFAYEHISHIIQDIAVMKSEFPDMFES